MLNIDFCKPFIIFIVTKKKINEQIFYMNQNLIFIERDIMMTQNIMEEMN